MRSKALVAGAVAATALVGAAGTALATTSGNGGTPTSGATTSCDADAHWPAYVQGMPDGFDPGDDGVYLWHNPSGGWGLRVSHPVLPGKANRVVFSGAITSRGTIGSVVKVRDEKDDVVKVGPDGHTLYFRFVNYGGVDGVDFTTTCTPGLRAGFKADGTVIATRFVHLGDHKVSPGSDPFIVRRSDRDVTTTAPATAAQNPPASTPAA
ncbi:MAG TPA: hypothetical protein VFA11_03810 [Acidimicrobiales bacterium]|nr:hypothetical protein [Acidimicrobiales bacterium]